MEKIHTSTQLMILKTISKITGIAIQTLQSAQKTEQIAVARGVYYLICREHRVPLQRTAKLLNRKHSTALKTARRYRLYTQYPHHTATKIYKQTYKELYNRKI